MVSSYTSNLRFTKQGDNDNPNTWGDITNTQVIELLEESIAGVTDVSITGSSNVEIATGATNGATDNARHAVLRLTGTLGASINFTVPDVQKTYVVEGAWTDTGGPWTVSLKTSGGSTVDITTGEVTHVFTNGTTIKEVSTFPLASVATFSSGMILMWSGLISAIPSGWVLCDGTNSTPDLRDQMIVGGRQDDGGSVKTNITGSLTISGGSVTTATGSSGSHSHTGSTGSHVLTIGETPAHTHTVSTYKNSTASAGSGGTTLFQTQISTTSSVGGGGGHVHTIGTEAAHTHTLANLNPYYALALIMKS